MAEAAPDQLRAELENTLRDLDVVVERLCMVVELVDARLHQLAGNDDDEGTR